MRKLVAWGVKTSIQGEIALWEAFHDLAPLLPPGTENTVTGLLCEPDFHLHLPDQVLRFWSTRRLASNKQAADVFRSVFKAMDQDDFDFLFCLSPDRNIR